MKKVLVAICVIGTLFTTGCYKETKNCTRVKTVGDEIVEIVEIRTIEIENKPIEVKTIE